MKFARYNLLLYRQTPIVSNVRPGIQANFKRWLSWDDAFKVRYELKPGLIAQTLLTEFGPVILANRFLKWSPRVTTCFTCVL